MANKVIISILILLVVLSGGLGGYAYLLNEQVQALSGQLQVFQQEQSARISAVNDGLAALRGQTMARIDTLENQIDNTQKSCRNQRQNE